MSSHVFHRTSTMPPVATNASGIEITDAAGKEYIDASGGAAVSCIGHGDLRVVEAIRAQAASLEYAHTGAFTSQAAEDLADRLCAATPLPLDRVFLNGSGSEAVETALKMARGYHLARGDVGRYRIIARRQSYHGNTLGALARGGSIGRQRPYQPMLGQKHVIEPCNFYRLARPDEAAEEYGRRAAAALEAEILELGPETVAAFLAETVVGATAGALPPVPGYLKRVQEICDKYGVLLILDEVMCGSHRCGPFLACEEDGVTPDIVTLGKGLGGGYQPIAATLCTAEVHDAFADAGTNFVHGHTYSGHPIACAAALAVQDVISQDRLAENVVAMGERLREGLHFHFDDHPLVGDIRGRGLLVALEIVADKDTKTPLKSEINFASRLSSEAKARGLLIYPGSGTMDGLEGDHALLAPPYSIAAEEVDEIVGRLGAALEAATASLK